MFWLGLGIGLFIAVLTGIFCYGLGGLNEAKWYSKQLGIHISNESVLHRAWKDTLISLGLKPGTK